MDVGRILAVIFVAVAIILPFAGATSASTDFREISMTSCSRGSIYAYIDNTETSPSTLTISAYYGKLTGSVVSPIQDLPAYESRGSQIDVYAPQCFKGSEDVQIYYRVCPNSSASTSSCASYWKTVRVNVEPCTVCPGYSTEQYLPSTDNYEPAASTCVGTGCGQPLYSRVNLEQSFDTSDLGVDITFAKENYAVAAGTKATIEATVRNTGAPVTVDLGFDGYYSDVGATLYERQVGLERGESKTVDVYANTMADRTGTYCFELVASRKGYEIGRTPVCLDVYDSASANITAPSAAVAGCDAAASYLITIANTGVSPNVFSISANSPAVTLSDKSVFVDVGNKGQVGVTVNASKLGGAGAVTITVTGSRESDLTGTTLVQNVTTAISAPACQTTEPVSNDGNASFIITEPFYNPSLDAITGVTATIQGLPAGFTVVPKQQATDVAPGTYANFTLLVQAPKGAASANGMLVLTDSNGRIVRQRPITLNALSTDGSISGFFSRAVGSNLTFIIALVLGAAVVALIYAKRDSTLVGKLSGAVGSKSAVQQEKPQQKAAAGPVPKISPKDIAEGDAARIFK